LKGQIKATARTQIKHTKLKRHFGRLDRKFGTFLAKLTYGSAPFGPTIPRAQLRRHRVFQELVHKGIHGRLAQVLHAARFDYPFVYGQDANILPHVLLRRGWKALQGLIFSIYGTIKQREAKEIWYEAFMESLVFERMKFCVRWCTYKKHWFLSDDPRREDCPEHRVNGQAARWRKGVLDRERARAKLATQHQMGK
jgi:hypothetical protein